MWVNIRKKGAILREYITSKTINTSTYFFSNEVVLKEKLINEFFVFSISLLEVILQKIIYYTFPQFLTHCATFDCII